MHLSLTPDREEVEKIMIHIKHRLKPLWGLFEFFNDQVFNVLFAGKLRGLLLERLPETSHRDYMVRELHLGDLPALSSFLCGLSKKQLAYFSPHGFDARSLSSHLRRQSFLMMGVFSESGLIGYFFLRFFLNKKCFVGRIVAPSHQKMGIGTLMNKVMYQIAWDMGFRCLGTISRNNEAVVRAHSKNPHMVVIKELNNNYLLVEFKPKQDAAQKGI